MKKTTEQSQTPANTNQSTSDERLRFTSISLFPEMFDAVKEYGVVGKAIRNQVIHLDCINPREFTEDRHRTVDDRPYGGGPGMVMQVQPLRAAIGEARSAGAAAPVIYLSPQGRRFDQQKALELAGQERLILVTGRYEGIDERFIETVVDEEICVGDFIVSGGELPAMMLMDGMIRLIPGALGHNQSAEQDSFSDGLLDCPHYTRPVEVDGMGVPEVLQEGHHAKIEQWRHEQKLLRTKQKRPDLYTAYLAKLSEAQDK